VPWWSRPVWMMTGWGKCGGGFGGAGKTWLGKWRAEVGR
jgi:hypothetical protein